MITADKDLARKVVDEMGQLAESNPASRYSFISARKIISLMEMISI